MQLLGLFNPSRKLMLIQSRETIIDNPNTLLISLEPDFI
jgi:hypothetical protein